MMALSSLSYRVTLRLSLLNVVGGQDTHDDDDGGYCVVYPDGVDGYVLVRPSSIMEAPESEDTIH